MAETTTSLASISMTGEQRAVCFLAPVILHRVITDKWMVIKNGWKCCPEVRTGGIGWGQIWGREAGG